jgi:antirestriction protein ArdC
MESEAMKNRTDIYTRVTDRIIEALERGVRPWVQPWASQSGRQVARPLRHNGVPYRGVNVLLLWAEAIEKRFTSPYWLTYRQALELKGHVRKGETGSVVVYSKKFTQIFRDEGGEEVEEAKLLLRSYVVFNVNQIDGLPAEYDPKPIECNNLVERIKTADDFFTHTGAAIIQGGDTACYIPSLDRIHIPRIDSFRDAESFYSTLAHECTHWTMHASRLNRTFGSKRWGDEGYAVEELVADCGAAFLCADLNLNCESREDHASYLAHWLKVLKADRQAIFTAASHAQRACDFLHSLQPNAAGREES